MLGLLLQTHWTAKLDKIAFTVFGWDVAWYGIIITSAMLLGLFVGTKRGKKFNLTADDLLEVFLFAIPLAVVFARIGYVMVRSEYFPSDFGWSDFVNLIAVWDGGVTITTGVIGGALGSIIWAKWRKVDILLLFDVVLPPVLLAQALGRWANFPNQEIYGAAVTNPSWQFFPYAVFISNKGGFYQAAFFYESMLNLIGFIVICMVLKRLKLKGAGGICYMIAYPFIRFIMEFIRDDGDIYKVVNFTQIIMLVIVIAFSALLIYLIIDKRKKGHQIWYGKGIPKTDCFDAKWKRNVDENGEKIYIPEIIDNTKPVNKKEGYNKSKKGKKS